MGERRQADRLPPLAVEGAAGHRSRPGRLRSRHGRVPPDTSDIRRDLRTWLHAQVEFLAAAQIRTLAATAEDTRDAEALYQQLTGPGRDCLIQRLRAAAGAGQIRAGADLEAAADALTYQVLAWDPAGMSTRRPDGLLDVLLDGLQADGGPGASHPRSPGRRPTTALTS